MPGVTAQQLLTLLAKGKPVPGILLLGNETYLRGLCRKKIIDTFVAEGVRDWGVVRLSAEEDGISSILGQAQTLPMLAPRQVIFVSDVEAWERLGENSRESLVKELSAYLENPAPYSILVLEASSLDQRMKLAKTLLEKTITVGVQLAEDPGERVKLAVPIVSEMARDLGVEIDNEVAEQLSDLLNGQLASIRTELEKLAAYAGDGRKITCADVDLLVVSAQKYTVWELADMLAAGHPSRALEFLDSLLREGEALPALLGALAWTFRKLLEAQEVPLNTVGWQAASRLKMRQPAAEQAVQQSRKFTRAQLTSGLEALYEADSRLKSGGTSQRAVMEFLVVQLAAQQ